MITISELIKKLQKIKKEHGDLPLLQQADSEGNSYDWSAGVELGFVDDDLEYCYSSEKDILEEGYEVEDYRPCAVIWP